MRVLGIDPGLSGGLAVLDEERGVPSLADLVDMPTTVYGKGRGIDGRELSGLLREWSPDMAVIESVHAMPKQGVSSTFAFGRGVGIVVGCLLFAGIPFVEVTPQVWQKAILAGVPGDGKTRAFTWAWSMFPDAELKTERGRMLDGRSDALALAWFGLGRKAA